MWHALADGIGVLMASHVFFGECGVLGGFFVLLFFFFLGSATKGNGVI